jgi:GNAT superfamily N-acetyltransferase
MMGETWPYRVCAKCGKAFTRWRRHETRCGLKPAEAERPRKMGVGSRLRAAAAELAEKWGFKVGR